MLLPVAAKGDFSMMRIWFLAALLALAVSLLPASAASNDEVIDRWYAMLVAANADGLSQLLADNVKIKLDDLGIEQNKAEFLGSMDEWKVAVAGAGIRHKVEGADGPVTTVLACYDFAENDILIRETFRIESGLITENTQTNVAEDCNAF